MRVLIATLGSRGDVQPMLALAVGLHERGHRVIFAGPSDAQANVEARGIAFLDLGVDAQRFLNENPDVQHGRARSLFSTRATMATLLDAQFRVLEPTAAEVDLIVGGGAVSAPSSIAEAMGIPYRLVAFGAMAIPSQLHAPYLIPISGLGATGNRVLWRVTDVMLRTLIGKGLDRHRRRLGLGPASRPSRILTPPGSLLLAADPELSPPPVDYDPAITVTGALRRPVDAQTLATPLPAELEAFVAAGPPPVYVGFGSMTDADQAGTTRLIVDAVERTGMRAIISSGWAGLGGTLPGSCIACGEVAHDALFPRTSAVVHHGGAGTTATAARAGVPQILIPHLLDQFYWAHRVRIFGIGPRAVPRRALTAERLAGALATVRDAPADGPMRTTARALGLQLRDRDGVAAAVTALEAVPLARRPR